MSEEAEVSSGPTIQDVEFDELKNGIDSGSLILIDVRDPQELETQGKIPKSINIPLPEIPEAFKKPDEEFQTKYGITKKDSAKFVFSCRGGKRAEAALNHAYDADSTLDSLGLYRGSFSDWEAKGGPVEKP